MAFSGFILIAEDDEDQRFLFKHSLRFAGLKEDQFEILEDALHVLLYLEELERTDRPKPDLLITDLRMPKMDGFELAEKVRSMFPALPIVVLTAALHPSHRKRASNTAGLYLLQKPQNQDETRQLLHSIRNLVPPPAN